MHRGQGQPHLRQDLWAEHQARRAGCGDPEAGRERVGAGGADGPAPPGSDRSLHPEGLQAQGEPHGGAAHQARDQADHPRADQGVQDQGEGDGGDAGGERGQAQGRGVHRPHSGAAAHLCAVVRQDDWKHSGAHPGPQVQQVAAVLQGRQAAGGRKGVR